MRAFPALCLILGTLAAPLLSAAPRKTHTVLLGSAKKVPYSKAGDPAGARPGEDSLKIRALVVDGSVKEWTTGDAHDVTDRSFVIRRAIRLNDELPGEKPPAAQTHWVWQRGPWLLVDRTTGHLAALKLPDYDPGVSQVSWFRDYGAYCGITASGKSLYAVVAQVAGRKPLLAKKLQPFAASEDGSSGVLCPEPVWQREPLRITFHPAGKNAISYDLAPGSAVLVEDAGDEPDSTPAKTK
jgi:hypothetical protein